jgi:hypothetical protein
MTSQIAGEFVLNRLPQHGVDDRGMLPVIYRAFVDNTPLIDGIFQ